MEKKAHVITYLRYNIIVELKGESASGVAADGDIKVADCVAHISSKCLKAIERKKVVSTFPFHVSAS
jgi:activator of HSP90 ATPase